MKKSGKLLLSILLTVTSSTSVCVARDFTSADLKKMTDAADYIVRQKPAASVLDSLLSTLPEMTLADALPLIDESMSLPYAAKIVDAIYMTDNLKKGYPLEEARDAISFTTHFPFRRPNSHDFKKLNDVFNSSNETLHKAYLAKMPFVFRNSGAMPELMALQPLISQKTADSPEKTEAIAVFDGYAPLAGGKQAPTVTLTDENGKEFRFSDYKGKTVVIDVWATWCHNCLKKMPDFIALRDTYSGDDRVVFLTVSIDRRSNHDRWLNSSAKQSIKGDNNLIAESDETSEFEKIYKIGGIPRYIVIGPDGNLAEAFAPGPGEDLKKLIDSTIE